MAEITVFIPAVSLIGLMAWVALINIRCPFQKPEKPYWAYAKNPGLALELADSLEFVNSVLGDSQTKAGLDNRNSAIRYQKLDFVFIPLYVLFFAFAALVLGGWREALPAIVCVLVAAAMDYPEDIEILRMVEKVPGTSAKPFGRLKWFFYFAAIGAESIPLLTAVPVATTGFAAFRVLGAWLIATSLAGVISAIKVSFNGIYYATIVSTPGLFGLAAVCFFR